MKKILFFFMAILSFAAAKMVTLPTVNSSAITMNIEGESIDFAPYRGKYVLLEFFGTRCPMCMMEIEHLKSMQKYYPDIQVIAVELQNTPVETLKDFVFEKEINYPVIDFKNAYDLYMFAKNAAPTWQGQIPLMILFDRNGQGLTYFIGVVDEDMVLQTIKDFRGEDLKNATIIQTDGNISN